MKFSKLAALYKKCSHIHVVEFDGGLWLGTGAAIYRIDGSIKVDDEGLCSLLSISKAEYDRFDIEKNNEEIIRRLAAVTVKNNDAQVHKLPVNYSHGKDALDVYATERGAVMFSEKLIEIASTKEAVIKISNIGDIFMLTIWDGTLQAMIAPVRSLTEGELRNLERFTAQAKLARENKMFLPDEPEQLELDDYPF